MSRGSERDWLVTSDSRNATTDVDRVVNRKVFRVHASIAAAQNRRTSFALEAACSGLVQIGL
jgi:hypothetical protein